MTQNPTQYTPRRDSLAANVIGYFTNNPDEELHLDDIQQKFNATSRGNIHTQLGGALDAKLLIRFRNVDGDYMYKAGPGIRKQAAQGGINIDVVHTSHSATSPNLLVDPAAVQFEDDVPIPNAIGRTGANWSPTLGRMQVGQSFAIPNKGKYGLLKAICSTHKSGKARYTVRTLKPTDQVRVWRVS